MYVCYDNLVGHCLAHCQLVIIHEQKKSTIDKHILKYRNILDTFLVKFSKPLGLHPLQAN